MASCNCHPYFQYGMYVAGFFLCLWILLIFHYIFNGCLAYVKDSKFEFPSASQKIMKMFGADSYDVRDGMGHLLYNVLFVFAIAVSIIAYPLVLICIIGYSILRSLRFAFRLKTRVFTIFNGKKCLKEYKDGEIEPVKF